MSSSRRLQGEIEKTLKKINEGKETFEQIWDRVHNATSQNSKDRSEAELKREIKKLQKHRDQIKQWISSADIKDKRPLLEARKGIENLMERFKNVERESKTKAYSKEGLERSNETPQDKAKNQVREWVSIVISTLEEEEEAMGADLEIIQNKKKASDGESHRRKVLDTRIKSHKTNIRGLEMAMRMLDNDVLMPEQIEDLREDVEYYMENEDDNNYFDDEMYTSLGIDSSEPQPRQPEPSTSKKKKKVSATTPVISSAPLSPTRSTPTARTTPLSPIRSNPVVGRSKPAVPVAIAALSTPTSSTPNPSPVSTKPPVITGTPSALPPSVNVPNHKEKLSKGPAMPSTAAVETPTFSTTSTPSPVTPVSVATKPKQSPTVEAAAAVGASIAAMMPDQAVAKALQSSLDAAIETAAEPPHPSADSTFSRLLESSFNNIPHANDSLRTHPYIPRDPVIAPASFPHTVSRNFWTPETVAAMDTDTLFFIFYHLPGTPQQLLAAKQLKKHSWRFHKSYLTWFQRREEPTKITEHHEEGTYVYFDYEKTWCQRTKSDFVFEYQFLENSV